MMGGNANNSQMQLGSGGHGRQPGAIGSLSNNFNIKDDKNAGAGNTNANSSGTGKKKGSSSGEAGKKKKSQTKVCCPKPCSIF